MHKISDRFYVENQMYEYNIHMYEYNILKCGITSAFLWKGLLVQKFKKDNIFKFPLTPMGVLAPGSAHA